MMRLFVVAFVLLFASPAWATCILQQSTAATIKFGPFVDATDGVTAETALTIQKADVRLSKNGGNYAAATADQGASDAGAPHDEIGDYDLSLGITDTDAPGHLRIHVRETGALPVWMDCEVKAPALTVLYGGAIVKDSVNVTRLIPIKGFDGSPRTGLAHDTANLKARFRRFDAGNADMATLTLVAGTRGSHADGGFVESDAADGAGTYEVSFSDVMVATGADELVVYLSGAANMGPTEIHYDLVDLGLANIATTLGTPVDTDIATDIANITGNAIAELSAGAPPATPTLYEAVMALYMAFRNKTVTTNDLQTYHNDAGTAVFTCGLATVAGSSFTKSECSAP